MRIALDARQFGWVRESAALEQLEGSTSVLLDTLARQTHVPSEGTRGAGERGDGSAASSPLSRERHAGIAVTDDVEAGLAEYMRLRDSWDAPVVRLAGLLSYTPEHIDVSLR